MLNGVLALAAQMVNGFRKGNKTQQPWILYPVKWSFHSEGGGQAVALHIKSLPGKLNPSHQQAWVPAILLPIQLLVNATARHWVMAQVHGPCQAHQRCKWSSGLQAVGEIWEVNGQLEDLSPLSSPIPTFPVDKNACEIKTFSDKQGLRIFVTSSPALWEMFKFFFFFSQRNSLERTQTFGYSDPHKERALKKWRQKCRLAF